MEDSKGLIAKIVLRVEKSLREELEKNEDSSYLTPEKIKDQLHAIARCEYELDLLLSKTDDAGGFGSFYPKKSLEHLKLMRAILETELKE